MSQLSLRSPQGSGCGNRPPYVLLFPFSVWHPVSSQRQNDGALIWEDRVPGKAPPRELLTKWKPLWQLFFSFSALMIVTVVIPIRLKAYSKKQKTKWKSVNCCIGSSFCYTVLFLDQIMLTNNQKCTSICSVKKREKKKKSLPHRKKKNKFSCCINILK